MRNFWRTANTSAYIPFFERLGLTAKAFSTSGRALFYFFAAVCIISSVSLVYILNESLLVSVASHGGEVREGIIGAPRFINPVLAVSDADRDLTSLIYSGLLKATPEGDYRSDLAKSYNISPDGKVYTFVLRNDATFHNGMRVTADDIIFTIEKTQDPSLKSPLRANWDGITVEKIDNKTVRFTLKAAYAPFIENATLGILPKNLWENVSNEEFPFSDLNTSPVGSGPFKIGTISRTASGLPSSYTLKPFSNYTLGQPYLDSMVFRFYQSEQAQIDALKNGEIDAVAGISPTALAQISNFPINKTPLNRVFGIFFNQNQSTILRDKDVRVALDMALDREGLVDEVLKGYGTPLSGPIPPQIAAKSAPADSANKMEKARQYLLSKGWTYQDSVLSKTTTNGKTKTTVELAFTLSTSNVPELRAAAEYVRKAWSSMGARVDVQIFDQGDLSQNVIRPRKYDALLFGEIIGRERDLYAFWHSGQRNDPGLNIALYANATVDSLLEEMRTTSDTARREQLYTQFVSELTKDVPALFLYTPDFVYSIPNDIQGLSLGSIETPSDRFLSVASWHRQTDYVWPIFAH
ncbi:hypothetical protein KW798_01605 [Candidatus Parcubacteria bacterium]|nr:hypothetical protein [Candidatus Parcubacteria bacterium]